MKKFSKILSVALLVALVLSFGAMAWATEEGGQTDGAGDPQGLVDPVTTKTITLTGGKAGHTYTLYQIFTGKVATVSGEQQLTDIQWGSGVTATFQATKETAAAYAKEVATANDARATAEALIAANALTNGTDNALAADGNVVFEGLAEGYYVIVDTNGNPNGTEGDYSSAVIVQVVNDVNGKLKGSGTTSDKKVKDVNDTTGEKSEWQESADYDIGDAVPFQLSAKTADNVAMYKKYHVTFQDTQSAGLDAPTSWTVNVLGKEFTVTDTVPTPAAQTTDAGTKITVQKVTPDSGKTFAIKVTFEPTGDGVVYLNSECNEKTITVEYTAVLNSDAQIGSAVGNPNTSYIRYSNNPESTDDSDEGTTPPVTVIVFTYKVDVDKIDETGAPLKKAGFTLYKKVKTEADIPAGKTKVTNDPVPAGAKQTTFAEGIWYVVGTITAGEGTNFMFKGIDDGTYVLVESETPDGYNTMDPVTITVTAEHGADSSSTTGFSITTFTTGNDNFKADAKGGQIEFTKKNGNKKTLESGEIYGEIINNSGTQLPSTGGIGTTIFYAVGGILVLAAIVLLITKKRMSD